MKDFIKSVIVLFLITCISGALLGGVYAITEEPRAQAVIEAKKKAYKKVFNTAETFDEAHYDKDALNKYLKDKGVSKKEVLVDEIVLAKDHNGSIIGAIVTVTSKEGYGGDIQFTVGFNLDKTISGLSVLSISETAGLGDNATKGEFLNQFKGKKVDSFVVTKTGKTNDNEIDAISSATITSKAMVKGTNTAITVFEFLDKTGGLSYEK